MIVETLSLKYTPDALTQRFARIAHLPWAMLLSSGNADHADNRFDILTADPRVTLTTRGPLTAVCQDNQVIDTPGCPLQLVHKAYIQCQSSFSRWGAGPVWL